MLEVPQFSLQAMKVAARAPRGIVLLPGKAQGPLSKLLPSPRQQLAFAALVIGRLSRADFFRRVNEPPDFAYDAYALHLAPADLNDFGLLDKPSWYVGLTEETPKVVVVSLHGLKRDATLANGRVVKSLWQP